MRGKARALHALGRDDEAARIREAAVVQALAPWARDPCGLDRVGRLTAVASVASDGEPFPPSDAAARRALAGDHARWASFLADQPATPERAELLACLGAFEGEDLGPAWVGPAPEVAAEVLPGLARAAIARLPEDVQRLAVAREGVIGEGEELPGLTLRLDEGDRPLEELAAEPGPLVLSLWASWCGPCQEELPRLDALVGRLQADGLAVQPVAISVDDDPRPYRRQLRRSPLPHLRTGRDPTLLAALGASSLPITWVVDDEAIVRLVHVGYDPGLPARIEALVRAMEE